MVGHRLEVRNTAKKLQPFVFGHLHILALCGTEEMYAMNPRARRHNIRLKLPTSSYRIAA
jgi:predicted phosphodiesterase